MCGQICYSTYCSSLTISGSPAGAMSDATLIARLGNEHTAGPALQQIAERQAMSMQASSSGHPNAMHGWAGADKYAHPLMP